MCYRGVSGSNSNLENHVPRKLMEADMAPTIDFALYVCEQNFHSVVNSVLYMYNTFPHTYFQATVTRQNIYKLACMPACIVQPSRLQEF